MCDTPRPPGPTIARPRWGVLYGAAFSPLAALAVVEVASSAQRRSHAPPLRPRYGRVRGNGRLGAWESDGPRHARLVRVCGRDRVGAGDPVGTLTSLGWTRRTRFLAGLDRRGARAGSALSGRFGVRWRLEGRARTAGAPDGPPPIRGEALGLLDRRQPPGAGPTGRTKVQYSSNLTGSVRLPSMSWPGLVGGVVEHARQEGDRHEVLAGSCQASVTSVDRTAMFSSR